MSTTAARSSLYAWCQLAGWSLYAVAVAIPNLKQGVSTAQLFAYSAALGALGFLQTHGLRAWARRRGWDELEIRRLVPRAMVSSAVMGLVLVAFMLVADVYWFRIFSWDAIARRWHFFVFSWVWWFFPAFVGWHAIYFAVQFVRKARRAEVEKWQLATAAQTAELRFLKAQLNPHFLFNALNSLRGLIGEDPARAQTMVTQLSAILRHAMSGATGAVPLSRELEVVGDYLALESVRLEERLRVTMDVAPEALAATVPAMLVQGLVENGIKHGVALLPDGGELSISARLADATLHVTVTNTAAPPRARAAASEGIGLANARERLRLLFGSGATLELEPTPPGCMTARVQIPGTP
jgi:hypothetical protein